MRIACNGPCAVLPRERMNSPQQERKAPQTARGITRGTTPGPVIPRERCAVTAHAQPPGRDRGIYPRLLVTRRRAGMPRLQSAQADFVWLLRRIHSLCQPGFARRSSDLRSADFTPISSAGGFAIGGGR
jgi:hypothetical protein